MTENSPTNPPPAAHRRRPRYPGKNPRRFEDKYKEHAPARFPETIAKVIASGKTPAGSHRPVMVAEVLDALTPKPRDVVVDCTLGYGGHAQALLQRIQPGGQLIGLDSDPIELPRTEARLRALGFDGSAFRAHRGNFAGLAQRLAGLGLGGADAIFADLGVSSMQIDDPARGFAMKLDGPLDMRMNPHRGQPASLFLQSLSARALADLLAGNSDEPNARQIADALAGKSFTTTTALAAAVRATLPRKAEDELERTVRRVFQAVRIAVNDEFGALEMLLRHLPACLRPGGRVAFLTFHSGEDRRVKKSFEAGLRAGDYAEISPTVTRPSPEECGANPRATSAKLRWARKAA